MQLVFHPTTNLHLAAIARDMPQSLLLSGRQGAGLATVARFLASKQLAGTIQPTNTKGEPDANGTISVEAIRGLYQQTRAKHARKHIYIIDDADRMSAGAAAAFLKLLEEPNPGTYFILTTHAAQALLPTIRSRVQRITIQSITESQSADYIASLGIDDPTKRAQLLFIASGLPAELSRLAHDTAYFSARAAIIGDAHTLLQGDTYQRLLVAQKYQSDRTTALRLIDGALTILRRSMSSKPQASLTPQLEQLLAIKEAISAQHNIRLQLTRFVL
jgi:DNA polymerase-3 subunit delta'